MKTNALLVNRKSRLITKAIAISIYGLFSANTQAALVSSDWNTVNDSLVVHDTASGLNWLKLTETNDLSYDYVSSQLGIGGVYEGFRYATINEVVNLWSNNFGVDLSMGAPTTGFDNPGVADAANWLGNIANEYNPSIPYGVSGVVLQEFDIGLWSIGAFNNESGMDFYSPVGFKNQWESDSFVHTGSYLVSVSSVPVPAAVWLFGSGLLGLIGVARKKKD